MNKITIELTDEQLKALSCVCLDPEEYIQNFASVRSDKAFADIVKQEIDRIMEENLPMPSSKEEIIMNATSLKDKKEQVQE